METRANYVLIGAFVLMAAMAAALFAMWMSRSPFTHSYSTFDVVFEGPVNGLSEGGEVRFNGIKVGEVKQLSLDRSDPNRVIARIRVDGETPVREDSVAQLNFQGITGVTFIQILAGTRTKPLLVQKQGAPPPVIPTERTALDELFQGGQDLLTVTGDTIQNLNQMITEENVETVTAILKDVKVATGKIANDGGLIDTAQQAIKSIDETAKSADKAIKQIDQAAADFNKGVNKLSGQIDSVYADIKPLIADGRAGAQSFASTMAQLDQKLAPSATQTLEQFSLTATDLRALMLRLQALTSSLEEDPSKFIFRQPPPVEGR